MIVQTFATGVRSGLRGDRGATGPGVNLEFWRAGGPLSCLPPELARRFEQEGWDGHMAMDSQSLAGDPYVILGAAAASTSRLLLGTGVTNTLTRELSVTAAAITTVQAQSNGRAVLGIGRGDSALAFLGRGPVTVREFERALSVLQALLRGEEVAFAPQRERDAGSAPGGAVGGRMPQGSRLGWIPKGLPKVPLDVAATGARVITVASRIAERVTISVGAEEERVGEAVALAQAARRDAGLDPQLLRLGAQVVVIPHDDVAAARDWARPMVASLARFKVLDPVVPSPDDDSPVLDRLRDEYDMTRHSTVDKMAKDALPDEFIDRFAIVGPVDHCIERLVRLVALGIDHFHTVGVIFEPQAEEFTRHLFVSEVMPAVRQETRRLG
jgi:5,10-methylenetetrahydromethanopterin reductase